MTASREPAWPYPRVMAHRCGGALAPENSLAGMIVAARLDCRGIEFDVMLSADGNPWLIHDETLDRTTNGTGRVCESLDSDLAALDAGVKHHPAFSGTRLPTFAEAMAQCRSCGLFANIEIKPAAGYETATGAAVAQAIVQDRGCVSGSILLSSFSEDALQAAWSVAAHLPRALLLEAIPDDWQTLCARLGVAALHVDSASLTEAQARAVKAAGYQLAAYTENDPARADELLRWGVDCIITDRPDIVRA